MSLGGSIKINRELPEESFHGPSSELQIYNFLEWGPDLEGFIFMKWFRKNLVSGFNPVSNQDHLTSVKR